MLSGKINPTIFNGSVSPNDLVTILEKNTHSEILSNIVIYHCSKYKFCGCCKYIRKDDRCSIARLIYKLYTQQLGDKY